MEPQVLQLYQQQLWAALRECEGQFADASHLFWARIAPGPECPPVQKVMLDLRTAALAGLTKREAVVIATVNRIADMAGNPWTDSLVASMKASTENALQDGDLAHFSKSTEGVYIRRGASSAKAADAVFGVELALTLTAVQNRSREVVRAALLAIDEVSVRQRVEAARRSDELAALRPVQVSNLSVEAGEAVAIAGQSAHALVGQGATTAPVDGKPARGLRAFADRLFKHALFNTLLGVALSAAVAMGIAAMGLG